MRTWGGRRALVACVGAALAAPTACAPNPAPEPSPAGTPRQEAAGDSLAAAALGDTLADRVLEAEREARRAVAGLDEATRREFVSLFGTDPLGLARIPQNAGRYEIPLVTNRAVRWWMDYFREEIPDRFALYLRRLGRYESMIRTELRRAGLPSDLLYLSLIESGMNPNAYSRAGAAGLWQFMPATARRYGLEVSYWTDERRDPVLSTRAAIRHLSDLYEEFGSWYLAAAAYNAGAGRVRWGIRYARTQSYWELVDARVLRRETRNYVPKLIAAALIARHPHRYGFGDVEPEPAMAYDVVEVPDATSLDVIAEAAGVEESRVRRLNPEFRRHVTPPGRRVEVRVPAGQGERFATKYAEIPPSERVTWVTHVVTRGQTLSHIAARYGTTVSAIRAANLGIRPRRLRIGQRLVIPGIPGAQGSVRARAADSPGGPTTVVVRRGDTLWAIARRYDVTTRDLMRWNGLESSLIRPGDRLTIRR